VLEAEGKRAAPEPSRERARTAPAEGKTRGTDDPRKGKQIEGRKAESRDSDVTARCAESSSPVAEETAAPESDPSPIEGAAAATGEIQPAPQAARVDLAATPVAAGLPVGAGETAVAKPVDRGTPIVDVAVTVAPAAVEATVSQVTALPVVVTQPGADANQPVPVTAQTAAVTPVETATDQETAPTPSEPASVPAASSAAGTTVGPVTGQVTDGTPVVPTPTGRPAPTDGPAPTGLPTPAAVPASSVSPTPAAVPASSVSPTPAVASTVPADVEEAAASVSPASSDPVPANETDGEDTRIEPSVTSSSSRPGHEPDHGRGGEMRRHDPPAIGWQRNHAEEPSPSTDGAKSVGHRPAAVGGLEGSASGPGIGRVDGLQSAVASTSTTETRPIVNRSEIPVRAASRLPELAETLRTVVKVAATEGRTEARITLHPADLGEVRIRLRYEQAGVTAEVVADSRQAVQVLKESASDLRRSLESQGIDLLMFDVRQGDHERSGWLGASNGKANRHGTASDLADGDESLERETPVDRLRSPSSSVDVLA
jgi:hypothetical protein